MPQNLTVRFTDSQVARLAEHKRLTLVPTSAFIRLAVERALDKPLPVEPEVAECPDCKMTFYTKAEK
jgi:hypothetical protein